MSIASVHDPNVAVSMQGRFALYVEGVKCAFSQAQIMIEDGMIPRVALSVPATPTMRDLARRVRVHILHKEVVHDEWVVLFEGEILTRGFQKSPASRDLTFMVYHVTGLFDQYAITALDPVAATTAAMQAADIAQPSIGTANGNILNLFTPEAIVSEIKAVNKSSKITKTNITFSDFVKGSFLRYRKLIDASRVAGSYPNVAINAHRLIERIKCPSPELIDWDDFYTQLMGETLAGTAQIIGGRVTFYELMRTMAQFFLHQITINPHAESYVKQVQVKPNTHFNAIPRCNVVYSSMTNAYQFDENYAERPTRIQGQFYPPGAPASDKSAQLSRYFTVYGPTELQWRWVSIIQELEKKGGEQAAQVKIDPKTGALTAKRPKDGIPFITREEESKGIISGYYDIPRTLNTAIMHMVTSVTLNGGGESPVDTVAEADIPARAYETIKSDDEQDRIIKYWAFLCMALGDGNGIDPKRFKTGFEGDYYKKGDRLIHLGLGNTGDSSNKFASLPVAVPTKITYLGLKMMADFSGDGSKRGKQVTNHKQIRSTGVNFFIAEDGTIVQVLPRQQHLFSEPLALPYGIKIQGLDINDAMAINNRIPQFGISQEEHAKPPYIWNSAIKMTLTENSQTRRYWEQPWPGGLQKKVPTANANGLVDAVCIPAAWAQDAMEGAEFDQIGLHESEAMIYAWPDETSQQYPVRRVVKIIDKFQGTLDVGGTPTQVLYLKFSEPCVKQNALFTIQVLSKPDFTRDAHPFRPWVVIADGPAGPAVISKQSLENAAASSTGAITNKSQLVLGNHQNVVIGFDTNGGKKLSDAQVKAAGFLTAVIKELSSKAVGTSKAPKSSVSQRQQEIGDDDVKQANAYFPKNEGNFFKLDSWMGGIKAEAAKWQDKLFKDFTTWDKKLQEGKVDPLADVVTQSGEVDEAAPVHDISSAPNAGVEAEMAELADSLHGSKVEIQPEQLNHFIDYYAAAIINFQFYYQRFAGQSFSAETVFNPFMLVGYPALLLDDSEARYHLVAYVHAVNHVITPNSAYSQPTYTHVRNARTEKAIPYRNVQEQYFNVQLADQKNYKTDTEEGRAAYHAKLKKMNLMVETSMPIEMMNIGRSGKNPAVVPFVYHGGFGLGYDAKTKKNRQDYSSYASYCGYINTDLSWLDSKAMLDNFVFSDDRWLNFDDKQSDDLAEEGDIDTVKALNRVYRPIQKVGQNNLKRRQASLVAFRDVKPEEALDDKFLKLVDPHAEEAPDFIKVYAGALPTYNADGTLAKEGKPFAFDPSVQQKVRKHTELVNNRQAVVG